MSEPTEFKLRQQRLERLQRFLAQDPGNGTLRAELFDVALEHGDIGLADAQAAAMLRLLPEDAGWRNRQALSCLAKQDYRRAQQVLEPLLAGGVDNAALRYNLACALFGQDRFEEAAEHLSQLVAGGLARAPQALSLWLRAEQRLGRLDAALAGFEARLPDPAVTPEAWGIASLIAYDAQRWSDARAWAGHALAMDPRQREALIAHGSLALEQRELEAARPALARACELYPHDGRAWAALGEVAMLEGRPAQALDALERAVRQMPSHAAAWQALGWARMLTGTPRDGQAAFERALELDRDVADCHGGLALALAMQGFGEQARLHIGAARELERGNAAARYAMAWLNGDISGVAALRGLQAGAGAGYSAAVGTLQ